MFITLAKPFRRSVVLFVLLSWIFPSVAVAWNDKAHMAIAYVAYRNLSRHAKSRVDELLVLHPLYQQWTQDAPKGRAGLFAFVHAATWADCIQDGAQCPGFVEDGTDGGMTPPVLQEAWQNIGYSDKFMHKYWHFILRPSGADNIAAEPPKPNIETQLQLLTDTLNSDAEDAVKSYDLVWVENLVAELHQPLNCISRISAQHPTGDRNGRDVRLCKAPCTSNLHDYWDNLLGTESNFESGMSEGKFLSGIQNPETWFDAGDIRKWISDSIDVATRIVYSPAILTADSTGNSKEPDEKYHKVAVDTATSQAVFAGHRLAALLNRYLK